MELRELSVHFVAAFLRGEEAKMSDFAGCLRLISLAFLLVEGESECGNRNEDNRRKNQI